MNRLKREFLRQRPILKLLPLLGKAPKPKKWVFIVGCYNSGTSLLRHIFGQHPEISDLPLEGVALSDAWPRPEDFGWHRMWHQCPDEIALKPGPGMNKVAERVKKQWSFFYNDADILVEKSPANSARIEFIVEYFKPAYFIYLVRNGYAVCEGLRRKGKPEKFGRTEFGSAYPIKLCAQQWVATDQKISADKAHAENWLSLTYESLADDPASAMDRITDFLEIASIDQSVLNKSWAVHKKSSPIVNMNEASIARLSTKDIQTINEIAGDTLSRHGYHLL